MIIECKKSLSLLAIVLLTSLNCLAMEESAPMSDGSSPFSQAPKQRDIQKPIPSFARSFYTNRGYALPLLAAGATIVASPVGSFSFRNYGDSPLCNWKTTTGWLGTAVLTSYSQYNKRAEELKRTGERGNKLWYAAPFATFVAVGGLVGLGHFALASAGYIDASSYGESVWKNSLIKKLALSAANGAMQGAFVGLPVGVTSVAAACVEKINDAASQIGQDKRDRLANAQDTIEKVNGKEEEGAGIKD